MKCFALDSSLAARFSVRVKFKAVVLSRGWILGSTVQTRVFGLASTVKHFVDVKVDNIEDPKV